MRRAYRVIQWATGGAGRNCLRQVIQRPDLDLAGVWVHSESKVGEDAASLCGLAEPTGILATNDAAALVALDADCVLYTRTNPYYPIQADSALATTSLPDELEPVVAELVGLLASGKNVVSLTTIPLVWPMAWGDEVFDRISAACDRGRSSLRVQGIAPGLYSDALILLLSGMSERIDGIRLEQILNYSSYAQPARMRLLGFGVRPGDFVDRSDRIRTIYGPSMQILAAELGSELVDLKESVSFRLTDRPLDLAIGRIEAGRIGALRIVLEGSLDNGAPIVFEIVSRVADHLAPDWPHLDGREGFRIELAGRPRLRVELDIHSTDGNGIQITLNQAASLAVNSIPDVCEAPPGFHWFGDSPVTIGRRLGPAFAAASR